jgi:hypothetical protein
MAFLCSFTHDAREHQQFSYAQCGSVHRRDNHAIPFVMHATSVNVVLARIQRSGQRQVLPESCQRNDLRYPGRGLWPGISNLSRGWPELIANALERSTRNEDSVHMFTALRDNRAASREEEACDSGDEECDACLHGLVWSNIQIDCALCRLSRFTSLILRKRKFASSKCSPRIHAITQRRQRLQISPASSLAFPARKRGLQRRFYGATLVRSAGTTGAWRMMW